MNPTVASTDLKHLRQAVGLQRWVIGGLAGAVVLCLLIMLMLVGRERTILVPPVIEKTFWVAHDKVSPAYLEQMAAFVSYLVLDVSPHTVDWKKSLLLQYVQSDAVGELESRQAVEATRIKNANASTQFAIRSVAASDKSMSALISGQLTTYVNGHRTSEENKFFLAQFAFTQGRVNVKKFAEVTQDEINHMRKDLAL